MFNSLTAMLRDEEGATLVEYSLVVALIAGVCILVISQLGGSINTLFTGIKTQIDGANAKVTAPG